MSKKLRLSPVQREVVWVLSEAGEENLAALLNTVSKKIQANSRLEALMVFENAIRYLYRQGFIDLCLENLENQKHQLVPLTSDEATELSVVRVLKWDVNGGYWCLDATQTGKNTLVVTLTEKGQEVLQKQ